MSKSGHGVHRDLAWALKQQAQRAGEQAPSVRGADWRLATVTAVGGGTVTADGIVCRCLASYAAPAVGDVAVISQSGSGNWVALNRLAGSGTPLYTPVYRYKPADTPRANATLADDPDLTCLLDANAVYRVEFTLHYAAIDLVSGSAAGRFRTQWTVPAGASGFRSAVGPDQGQILSGTSSGGAGRWGVHQFGTACIYGDRNDNTLLCTAFEEATVFTTNAGTLALQWAQAVTNATSTLLAQGSSMRVTRIG